MKPLDETRLTEKQASGSLHGKPNDTVLEWAERCKELDEKEENEAQL